METVSQTGNGASPSHPGALVLDDRLPLRAGLGAAFAGVIGYARSRANLSGGDPVEAVHEYRKAVRRARALLRLSRPVLPYSGYRSLNAELRRAVAETSAVRDVHVLREALQRLPLGKDARGRSVAGAAQEAMAKRQPREGAEQEVLRRGAWALRALPERFFRALPRDVSWSDLSSGLRKSYRRARESLEAAERSGQGADVHVFRKRVKELRYQLELFEAVGDWPPRREHRGLASLAQRLGAATDLIALSRFAFASDGFDAPQSQRLARAVDARVAALFERELPRARKLFRERPRRFAARSLERS